MPATANGSVAPLTSIQSGQIPGFGGSSGLAIDPTGSLWVTSCAQLTGAQGPVLAYSSKASGTRVVPAVIIGGSLTTLGKCQTGIALDSAGAIYVADTAAQGHVAIFAAHSAGNVAPIRNIGGAKANFHFPAGVAIDAQGNLYVADNGSGFPGFSGDVQVFAPGANGDVAATRTIAGSNTGFAGPYGLAFDNFGNLYVSNMSGDSITVFPPGTTGNAVPIRTISGSNAGLMRPTGIAVDGAGYLYVGNEALVPAQYPILVFSPSATGNAAPVTSIDVNTFLFAQPSGIALR